jgi:hypothetical protein
MRKDRYGAPRDRRLNVFEGDLVGETDLGAALVLQFRLSGGTEPSRGYDLEIEVSRLAHEKLHLHYVRQWSVSVQPSAVQLLEPRTIR